MNKRRERPPLSDRGRRRALRTWGFYLLALTAWVTVVLAAVLYSGQVIGDSEKQAALGFFRALPLTKYTVLVCEFANWASTAPLPCFVIKK